MSHFDNVQTSKMSQSEIHKFLNRKLYESLFKSNRSLRKNGYFENALLRKMVHFAIDHFEGVTFKKNHYEKRLKLRAIRF